MPTRDAANTIDAPALMAKSPASKVDATLYSKLRCLVPPRARGQSMHISTAATRLLCVLALALAFIAPHGTVQASNVGVVWRPVLSTAVRSDLPPIASHCAVSFNGNLMLAGGVFASGELNSKVFATADGLHWEIIQANAPFGARRNAALVVFNGRLWMMGGDDGTQKLDDVWSSSDGVHWEEELASAPWSARSDHATIAFNGKLFLFAGLSSSGSLSDVWSTTDGINWNIETANAGFGTRYDMAVTVFQGRIWVMAGYRGASVLADVWSSSNGVDWFALPAIAAHGFNVSNGRAVTLNGRMFVLCNGTASDANRQVWSTLNGADWVEEHHFAPFEARLDAQAVAHQNKIWIVGGKSRTGSFLDDVWWSENGRRWENEKRIENGGANLVPHEGHSILRFRDQLWTISGSGYLGMWTSTVLYSKDGLAWECAVAHAPFAGRQHQSALVFNDRLWVIGGKGETFMNDVWSSVDGVTWTQETAAAPFPPRTQHTSFVLNGRMWVVGGADADQMFNDIWSSTDGVNWELETASAPFPPTLGHTSPIFGSRVWLIGGFNGTFSGAVWSSADGKNWRQETANGFPGRLMHATEVFNSRLWVIGGWKSYSEDPDGNDVWSSADGVTWVQATAEAAFTKRRDAKSFIQNNRLRILGGNSYGTPSNEAWSSRDGTHWIKDGPHPSNRFSPRNGHTLIEFKGRLFVIGGLTRRGAVSPSISPYSSAIAGTVNDVWASADGENWTQIDTGASFSPRYNHRTIVHRGRMYVIGGITRRYEGTSSAYTEDSLNDVWSSEDGETWVQEAVSAPFSPRYDFAVAAFGGKVWVIGGRSDSTTELADIWSSENGREWTLQSANAPFGATSDRYAFVFKDHLCLMTSKPSLGNFVWFTLDGENWASAPTFGSVRESQGALLNVGDELVYIPYSDLSQDQISHSYEGLTWQKKVDVIDPVFLSSGSSSAFFKNRVWIVGSRPGTSDIQSHDVWSTADYSRWRPASATSPLQDREGHTAVVFKDRIIVTNGLVSQFKLSDGVWSSKDGIQWTNDIASGSPFKVFDHASTVYDDRIWHSGGFVSISYQSTDQVYSSGDGFNWNSAQDLPFGSFVQHSMVVLNGKMWMFGQWNPNSFRSLWSTEDGETWSETIPMIGPLNYSQKMCVHEDEIRALSFTSQAGGSKMFSIKGDGTWSSSPLPVGMGNRSGEAFLSHAGKMVMVGGDTNLSTGSGSTNDVWTSADGDNWTRELVSAPFTPRTTHAVVSFKDRMWLIGGWNSGPGFHPARDDVWSSGQGAAPRLEPESITFGARDPANGPTLPVVIRLSNPFPDAWEPLVISGIRIENDPSGSFSFSEPPDLRAVLVGETREFGIIYTPSSTDYVTAQLIIETTDDSGEEIIVPVAAGTAPSTSDAVNWSMY